MALFIYPWLDKAQYRRKICFKKCASVNPMSWSETRKWSYAQRNSISTRLEQRASQNLLLQQGGLSNEGKGYPVSSPLNMLVA